MKHIILLTHGEFSQGIAQSAKFILGDVSDMRSLCITMDEAMEDTIRKVAQTIRSFQDNGPVILVTDIPGGSTTQAAIRSLEVFPDLYIVSGLCLGMLMQLIMTDFSEDREENLALLRELVEDAKETLTVINDCCSSEALSDEEGEL